MRIADSQDLGRYVRDRRNQLSLTQAQLAVRSKVSRRWLSDLEGGKETVDIGLVLRTLHSLGVVVDLQFEEQTGRLDLDVVLDRYMHRDNARPAVERLTDADLTGTDAGPRSARGR
jgi:HTH-type transcriptional regulator / antitoxin HipB